MNNTNQSPTLISEAFAVFYDGSEGHSAGYLRLRAVSLYNDKDAAKVDCSSDAYTPKKVYIYDQAINKNDNLNAQRYEKVRLLSPSMFLRIYQANIAKGISFDNIIDQLDVKLSNFDLLLDLHEGCITEETSQAWHDGCRSYYIGTDFKFNPFPESQIKESEDWDSGWMYAYNSCNKTD